MSKSHAAMLARHSLQSADVWGFIKAGSSKCLELFIPKQVCSTCRMAREGLWGTSQTYIYPSKLCYMPTTSWSSSRSGLINLMCLVRLSLSIQLSIDQISTISSIQQTEALGHQHRNWDAIDPTVHSMSMCGYQGKNSWLVSHKLERRWQARNSNGLIWFWESETDQKILQQASIVMQLEEQHQRQAFLYNWPASLFHLRMVCTPATKLFPSQYSEVEACAN